MADKLVDPTASDERVKPRPIVLALKSKPIMLIGQAPGLTEYQTGQPFSGDAGRGIRKLFAECGIDDRDFNRLVHTSAISKCYPGSKLVRKGNRSRREDLKPSSAMIANCSPFMMAQFELVNPKVIVLLGAMPINAYAQWKSGLATKAQLAAWVGRIEDWHGRRVIALAHTSGLSTWLNDTEHKALQEKAKHLLWKEVEAIRHAMIL